MGRPRIYGNRANKTLSINTDAYDFCIAKGYNASDIASKAFEDVAFSSKENVDRLEEKKMFLEEQLKELSERIQNIHTTKQDLSDQKQALLVEFKRGTSAHIINNPAALDYWSKKLNIPVDELIRAKKFNL